MAGPTCKIVGVSLCFAHGGGIRIRVKSHHPEFSLFYCGKRFLGRSTAAANAAAIVVCVVVIIMEVLPVRYCGDFSLCRDYLIKKTEFRMMTFHSNPNTNPMEENKGGHQQFFILVQLRPPGRQ